MSNGQLPSKNAPPPHFLVIVPGYMGSKLRDKKTGKIVWLNIAGLVKNPFKIEAAVDAFLQTMAYPNADLEPAGILDQILIAPPWIKQEEYGRLIDKLKAWGYQIDPSTPKPGDRAAYTFAYDWRQDNRLSGKQLGQAIDGWRKRHPGAEAWVITHSNGGIVARWYIQQEGGQKHVGKLLHMASPWDGAPKSVQVLLEGIDVLGLKKLNLFNLGPRLKDVIRTYPSFYQLIPNAESFLSDENNARVDLFGDPRWLDTPAERAFLADGLKFNQTLGAAAGVETTCFYGTRLSTTTAGVVSRGEAGKFQSIQWQATEAGDGTVPARSALHPWVDDTHRFRSPAAHGDIYVEDSVLDYLHFDLVDRYDDTSRAVLTLLDYSITFEPDKDFYSPGETIQAWAQLATDEGEPIDEADVKVRLVFREPLPGSTVAAAPPDTAWVRLKPNPEIKGRFEASLPAPEVEGYYRLVATVALPRKPSATLEELIAVEA